jgi:lysozyme family protein
MAKAKFTETLFNHLMLWEGREFENHPNDQPTKFGIIVDDIKECIQDLRIINKEPADYVEFLKNMDAKLAYEIIGWLYFNKLKLYELSEQQIADKICDMAMPMGRGSVTKCVQRALKALSIRNFDIKEDGIMGNITLSKIECSPKMEFLAAFRSECANRFRYIADKNQSKNVFLKGWLRRAYN